MKVILLGELRGKGGEGDVVDVAQGYAENYLFPRRLALPATPGNIKQLEERRHNIAKREEKRLAGADETKAALEGKVVTVEARVGIEIDRKRIAHEGSIKRAGIHEVEVDLYRTINAKVAVEVVPEGTLATRAAETAAAETAEEAVEEVAE